jgi:hypothetical protein
MGAEPVTKSKRIAGHRGHRGKILGALGALGVLGGKK